MAIDFYKLGKQSGAKSKLGRKTGTESLLGSITDNIGNMLEDSKTKTEELVTSMPQGVAIDKVPEELRSQVTNFLTENKSAYKEATKVLASGINTSSERYTEAVEVINRVNSKFQNLSGNLENIALQRQAALDDPNYSPNTSRSSATDFNNLANGSLYSSMTMNEDGSFNYKSVNGESKAFKDFSIQKQGFLGQQGFLGMTEHLDKNVYDVNGDIKAWEGGMENDYKLKLNNLFSKLKPKGAMDFAMADGEFLQGLFKESSFKNFESYKDALIKNPSALAKQYKEYNLGLLKERHSGVVAKKQESDKNIIDENNLKMGGYSQYSDTGGDPFSGKQSFQSIPFSDKVTRRSALLNLDNVPGAHFAYRHSAEDGWQAFDLEDNSFQRNLKGSEIATIEGLYNLYDASGKRSYSYFDAKRSTTRKEDLPPEGSEGISVKALKVKKAKDFQTALLKVFNEDILDDYTFENVTRVTEFGTDRIGGQVRVKSKDGKFNKIFNIGDKADDKLAIELNDLFLNYLAPDPLNPN
tara:strand:+ start:234 stop:1808 length:1575 start_codon:yes stop_codon:yes gene_type:complete